MYMYDDVMWSFDGLAIHLYFLNDLVIFPYGFDYISLLTGQLSQTVFLSVLELSIVKISSYHWSSSAICWVILPLSIVIITIGPCVDSLTVFLPFLELSLVLIAIDVLHDSLPMIFSILEWAGICTVAFFRVCALSAEFAIEPFSFVFITVSILYLSMSAFDIVSPLATIHSVWRFLHAFTTSKTFSKLAIIHALLDIGWLSLRRIFFFFSLSSPLLCHAWSHPWTIQCMRRSCWFVVHQFHDIFPKKSCPYKQNRPSWLGSPVHPARASCDSWLLHGNPFLWPRWRCSWICHCLYIVRGTLIEKVAISL